jgi:hypothetical protein
MIEFEPQIPADHFQLDEIEGLLKTSTISAENNEYWYKRLPLLNWTEAENLIEELLTKQVNRIHAGLNYNMGYLNWFLRKSI